MFLLMWLVVKSALCTQAFALLHCSTGDCYAIEKQYTSVPDNVSCSAAVVAVGHICDKQQ
jgi:hypothetical protein